MYSDVLPAEPKFVGFNLRWAGLFGTFFWLLNILGKKGPLAFALDFTFDS